jgi:hypothetical protein
LIILSQKNQFFKKKGGKQTNSKKSVRLKKKLKTFTQHTFSNSAAAQ